MDRRPDRDGSGDALAGPDGTAPSSGTSSGSDPADPAVVRAPRSDLRLPPGGDPGAVERWMDDDRERSLRPWEGDVRDVPPPRPLPPAPRPRRTLPPETPPEPSDATVPPNRGEGLSSWQRERWEEARFRADFGHDWRSGMKLLGGVRLGAPLLVLIAILIAVLALALHL